MAEESHTNNGTTTTTTPVKNKRSAGRKRSISWKWFDQVDSLHKYKRRAVCLYCGMEMQANPSQFSKHIAQACKLSPQDDKEEASDVMKEELERESQKSRDSRVKVEAQTQAAAQHCEFASQAAFSSKSQYSCSPCHQVAAISTSTAADDDEDDNDDDSENEDYDADGDATTTDQQGHGKSSSSNNNNDKRPTEDHIRYVHDKLVLGCIKGNIPWTFFENEEFRNAFRVMNPHFPFLSRRTASTIVVNRLFNSVQEKQMKGNEMIHTKSRNCLKEESVFKIAAIKNDLIQQKKIRQEQKKLKTKHEVAKPRIL
jgi:hypothetical protein